MDPNEALKNLIIGLENCDWEQAEENAKTLRGWLQGEGFMPDISNYQMQLILSHLLYGISEQ